MEKLKNQIEKANKAYRNGKPVMTDAEYDTLLNKLHRGIGDALFKSFKETLLEEAGDITHKYVIGSLDKLRYNEGDELSKWLSKHTVKELFVSTKLDGMSFVAEYEGGKFVQASTRGDGYQGESITDKVKHILPTKLKTTFTGTIRGELFLTGNSDKELGLKNRRNGVVGIIKEDRVDKNKLKHVDYAVYQILSSESDIFSQFIDIKELGLKTPEFTRFIVDKDIEETLKAYLEKCLTTLNYDMDGLVISEPSYKNENVYYPEKQVAFKVNSEGTPVKVLGIEWEVSRYRLLKPVLLLEPTEIDGATVGRCSGYNAQYIEDNNIGVGSVVKVIRSGNVIPKVIEIVEEATVELPNECPSCGAALETYGVDIRCTDEYCESASVKRVAAFIKELEIENVSEAQLLKFNIGTFKDLIFWKPSGNGTSQYKFYDELLVKMFGASETKLMRSMSYEGMGTTIFDKLIDKFESLSKLNDVFFAAEYSKVNFDWKSLPGGVGFTTINKAKEDWKTAREVIKLVVCHPSYKPVEVKVVKQEVKESSISGLSFVITGTLSVPRKQKEDLIKANGGIIASGVTKNLDYLIAAKEDSGSSKYKKANQLGINIITEAEFDNMLK